MKPSKKPAFEDQREIFRDPTKRRAWIIYQLKTRGYTLSAIARANGVSQQAISSALLTPSAGMEKVLAAAVDVPVHQLFPERYSPSGRRLLPTRPANRSSAAAPHNVESGAGF